MKIHPLENNVYYIWEDVVEKMDSIVLPKGARVEIRKAIIKVCGPSCELVQPGDKVLTSKHTGSHLFLCMEDVWTDGHRHRLCREDEFIALYADTPEEMVALKKRQEKRRKEFTEEKRLKVLLLKKQAEG